MFKTNTQEKKHEEKKIIHFSFALKTQESCSVSRFLGTLHGGEEGR